MISAAAEKTPRLQLFPVSVASCWRERARHCWRTWCLSAFSLQVFSPNPYTYRDAYSAPGRRAEKRRRSVIASTGKHVFVDLYNGGSVSKLGTRRSPGKISYSPCECEVILLLSKEERFVQTNHWRLRTCVSPFRRESVIRRTLELFQRQLIRFSSLARTSC